MGSWHNSDKFIDVSTSNNMDSLDDFRNTQVINFFKQDLTKKWALARKL